MLRQLSHELTGTKHKFHRNNKTDKLDSIDLEMQSEELDTSTPMETSKHHPLTPVVAIINNGELSQNNMTNPQNKRENESPTAQGPNKRYSFDINELLKQNKYYMPAEAEANIITEKAVERTEDSTDKHEEPMSQKIKIPAIIIHDAMNYQAVINDIKANITGEFTTQTRGSQIKVNLTNTDDYRSLTKYYDKEKNVKYYTFHNPDSSNMSVILKNLPTSISADEIKDELTNKKFKVISVTRLHNSKKIPIPVCAVELTKDVNSNLIYDLETLYYCKIIVEPRRKSRDIPQCTNCQRFNHTKNYCKLSPRCVKCTGDHHYTQCPKDRDQKAQCVNCLEEGHTANYKGCRVYRNLIANKRTPPYQSQKYQNNIERTYKTTTPNVSYANLANTDKNFPRLTKTVEENKPIDGSSIIEQIVQTLIKMLTPFIEQIKANLLNLIPALLQNGCK